MTSPPAPPAFRADLQGLRAVAISLVVLAHAGAPGFAGGFVGVDVFFVLSGYLITRLLVHEYQSSGRIRLVTFVARRLRRLFPALLAMLAVTMLMGTVLLSTHEFAEQTASVGYAATWTSNLFFAFTNFDYFAELHLRDLFLHTWSLGVEEQFYLVWPVLLLLLFTISKGLRDSSDGRKTLVFGFSLLLMGGFVLSFYWSSTMHSWAYYLMPSRVWQFALGAGVFAWFENGPQKKRFNSHQSIARGGAVVGIALIIGSAVFLHPDLGYPGAWVLPPSIGAAMVILAGSRGGNRGLSEALGNPMLVWVGDRSYSWYLWHWPLLVFGFAWGLKGNPVAITALVSLSALFAMASYRVIELPAWKGSFKSMSPVRVIAASFFLVTIVTPALVHMNSASIDDEDRGAQLAKSIRLDMPHFQGASGCDSWFNDAAVQPCVAGETGAKRTVVLFGDSIAAQWYSFLSEIYSVEKYRVVLLTKSSCAIVDEDFHYKPAGGIYEVCATWRNNAIGYLSTIRPDVIFLSSAATYGFSKEQWTAGTRRILNRLTEVADHVMVIPGTPRLSFDGPGCLDRWLARHRQGEVAAAEVACREPIINDQASLVRSYLTDAVGPFGNAKVLDLNDLVCPNGYCAARNSDGIAVFRDQQHLTDSFVRAHIPTIKERLMLLGVVQLLKGAT